MNLSTINAIRASAGLPALESKDNQAQKRRQAANQAARAQANRETKALRGSGKKAKA